jgi:hypothetical protein
MEVKHQSKGIRSWRREDREYASEEQIPSYICGLWTTLTTRGMFQKCSIESSNNEMPVFEPQARQEDIR